MARVGRDLEDHLAPTEICLNLCQISLRQLSAMLSSIQKNNKDPIEKKRIWLGKKCISQPV